MIRLEEIPQTTPMYPAHDPLGPRVWIATAVAVLLAFLAGWALRPASVTPIVSAPVVSAPPLAEAPVRDVLTSGTWGLATLSVTPDASGCGTAWVTNLGELTASAVISVTRGDMTLRGIAWQVAPASTLSVHLSTGDGSPCVPLPAWGRTEFSAATSGGNDATAHTI